MANCQVILVLDNGKILNREIIGLLAIFDEQIAGLTMGISQT